MIRDISVGVKAPSAALAALEMMREELQQWIFLVCKVTLTCRLRLHLHSRVARGAAGVRNTRTGGKLDL